MPRAIVLLSGGLDSATVAALAKQQGFEITALSFDYGQRHKDELAAAQRVARSLGITDHRVVTLGLGAIGGSALTSSAIDVPKDRGAELDAKDEQPIPATYVPARNTVFLSVALGLAEVVGAFELFFGANALDYSGYPDCRPEFVEAFEALANVATKAAVEGRGRFRVRAPLMKLSKAQIITIGVALGVDYGLTHSCYDPVDGRACGRCDSCILRRRGFEEAHIPDPTRYV
ncbi:7-cyano-7-deazaguanine synthase QueC [Myxococcota bacterium]|nr:7-cyano-7-deazaguanine synthase QueC [Myxococcota bacterium]